jgi:hypothetical protein
LQIAVREDGEVRQRYLTTESHVVLLSSPDAACIEARARGEGGQLSEPTIVCAADLEVHSDPEWQNLTRGCDFEVASEEPASNGCAVTPSSRGSGAAAVALLLSLSVLAQRRRR